MASTGLQGLCEFIARVEVWEIPPRALERAREVLVDTAGVIVGGSGTALVAKLGDQLARPLEAGAGATCFGQSGFHAPLTAALRNGIAGSSREFEEGNSRAKGHPAMQIVPALAAISEARGLGGAEFFSGLVLGYEAAARVSRAASLRRGLHPAGTWGLIGSALAVGRALRRSSEELFEIANIAASYCLSPFVRNSFSGYSAAETFAGVTNHLALLSNFFFESGVRADPQSFEITFSRLVSEKLAPEELVTGLGEDYAIAEGYLKPYPSCRFTHGAIDALRAILQATPVAAEEVEGISVETYDAAAHGSDRPPANPEAMRFSTPYLLATLLKFGEIGLEVLTEETLRDPEVVALAGRVTLSASREFEALRPRRSPARVEVRLVDSRVFSHQVMDALGDPASPLSQSAVRAKFLGLAEPVVGPDRAQTFLDQVALAPSLPDVRPLFALLRLPG